MSRIISWYSCGAASTIATKLALADGRDVIPVYCDPGAEHPDNVRYMADCERWFDRSVTVIHSEDYASTWDVFEKRRYLSGVKGALCTIEMKVIPRLTFQRPDDIHIFGYTADKTDIVRAREMRANYPELRIETPLIEKDLTKANCLALIGGAGINPPVLYAMGFSNNNCLPCVKATSPNYWALVRREFPEIFQRMVVQSRALGVRLTRIGNVRKFIDEIPLDWPCTEAISPACDFLCALIEKDIAS